MRESKGTTCNDKKKKKKKEVKEVRVYRYDVF